MPQLRRKQSSLKALSRSFSVCSVAKKKGFFAVIDFLREKTMKRLLALALLLALLSSCIPSPSATPTVIPATPSATPTSWWRDAVFYEVFVRSFSDSDGDGVGDFNGLAGRLDYLQSLGVNEIGRASW